MKKTEDYEDWVVMEDGKYYSGAHGGYCLMPDLSSADFFTKIEAEEFAHECGEGTKAVKVSAKDALDAGFHSGCSYKRDRAIEDKVDSTLYDLKEKIMDVIRKWHK